MTLRKQKIGNQKPWTIEELKDGLLKFFELHQHYPTGPEIDSFEYLPSARTIERSHHGVIELRKSLKLDTDSDYRTGLHSSKRAHTINDRAHKTEQVVYEYLIKRFQRHFVHRKFFFTDDHRTRADFFIDDTINGFCVDVFYPNSLRNLSGCLNIKLKKYSREVMDLLHYPVIFLQMNTDLTPKSLEKLLTQKKKGLAKKQYLMGWETFEEFCQKRKPFTLGR